MYSSQATRNPTATETQEPKPIKSVAQAKRDPQWGTEGSGGFRDAFAKEIKRVFADLKAIRYVTADR